MSEGMASAPGSEEPLAIICGAGSLPFAVAEAARDSAEIAVEQRNGFPKRGIAPRRGERPGYA